MKVALRVLLRCFHWVWFIWLNISIAVVSAYTLAFAIAQYYSLMLFALFCLHFTAFYSTRLQFIAFIPSLWFHTSDLSLHGFAFNFSSIYLPSPWDTFRLSSFPTCPDIFPFKFVISLIFESYVSSIVLSQITGWFSAWSLNRIPFF